jgi:Domain of unknown function (DUF5615)
VARFYLDESLTEQLVTLLIALGHDAVSTNALGRKGIRDHQQLLFAANEQRILITFNIADFVLLHEAWRDWSAAWGTSPDVARHAGILAIQQDKRGLSAQQLATVVHDLVEREESLANRLFVWQRATGWRAAR